MTCATSKLQDLTTKTQAQSTYVTAWGGTTTADLLSAGRHEEQARDSDRIWVVIVPLEGPVDLKVALVSELRKRTREHVSAGHEECIPVVFDRGYAGYANVQRLQVDLVVESVCHTVQTRERWLHT